MHNRWILCGLGRLGTSLNQGFIDSGFAWDLVCPSSTDTDSKSQISLASHKHSNCISWPNLLDSLREGDVVVLAVPDSAIEICASQLDVEGVAIIHCSGATPLLSTKYAATGVFYPLQTFNKSIKNNWADTPVFLEYKLSKIETVLIDFLLKLGGSDRNITTCDSQKRLKIHTAAVFANNFSQACVSISQQLLEESGIDFEVMLPILRKTASNWEHELPINSLTGPAVRGDVVTMDKHLNSLQNHPAWRDLYRQLSDIIKQMKS
jgi:predicted short-subunit dehydrogenase-like oxidoreductase (DUF2520 family)